jgi:hypothetical protein
MMIEQCLLERGTRAVCIREVQRTLKESSKRLIEDKLQDFRLGEADGFKVFNEVIEAPGDGIIAFQGMQDHNAESIKSLEGFRIAWTEEAQTLAARSLSLLRPTIRAPGSELWFSWNARRKTDPVDALLRGDDLPTGAVVVTANWRDNPLFPAVLEQERLDCLRLSLTSIRTFGRANTLLYSSALTTPMLARRRKGAFGALLLIRCCQFGYLRTSAALARELTLLFFGPCSLLARGPGSQLLRGARPGRSHSWHGCERGLHAKCRTNRPAARRRDARQGIQRQLRVGVSAWDTR